MQITIYCDLESEEIITQDEIEDYIAEIVDNCYRMEVLYDVAYQFSSDELISAILRNDNVFFDAIRNNYKECRRQRMSIIQDSFISREIEI